MKVAAVEAIVRAIGIGLGAAICPDNSSLYKLFSPPKIVGCGLWVVGSEEIKTAHYPLPTAHFHLKTRLETERRF
jgi:hypothetical protein